MSQSMKALLDKLKLELKHLVKMTNMFQISSRSRTFIPTYLKFHQLGVIVLEIGVVHLAHGVHEL